MTSYDIDVGDLQNMFRVDGKVAVVTGGSRGLGLSAASGLLQAGASKVIISSRKAQAGKEAVDALNALPNKKPGAIAISIPADLSKPSEVQRLAKEVAKHTDHVDILIANAGATWGAPIDSHPDEAVNKVLDLNVRSIFNIIRDFLPLLEKNATKEDSSRVIATGSVAGLQPGITGENGTYIYSASKAAVMHMMRNLAMALGPRHIMCNSIAPGFFRSKMANGTIDALGGLEKLASTHPNGLIGRPKDFAAAVVYLASPASAHINGAEIVLDGGKMWKAAL